MADPNINWVNAQGMPSRSYNCGFCGHLIASATGYAYRASNGTANAYIYVCPHCAQPTHFSHGKQLPGVRPGASVANLPKDIETAYNEARDCVAASAYTAAAMLCRKLLMHLAVGCGAAVGLNFKGYVEYMVGAGYVPPNGRTWVDHIRDKGNEVNHELSFASQEDANDLIGFLEMLLKFNYEFPARMGSKQPAAVARAP